VGGVGRAATGFRSQRERPCPEDERAAVLLYSGNAAFFKKVGMRLYTEGMSKLHEEYETATIENTRAHPLFTRRRQIIRHPPEIFQVFIVLDDRHGSAARINPLQLVPVSGQ
jgi:hypothetical protein